MPQFSSHLTTNAYGDNDTYRRVPLVLLARFCKKVTQKELAFQTGKDKMYVRSLIDTTFPDKFQKMNF